MALERSVHHSYAHQGAVVWAPSHFQGPWNYGGYPLGGRVYHSLEEFSQYFGFFTQESRRHQRGEVDAREQSTKIEKYRSQYAAEEVCRLPLVVLLSTVDAIRDGLPEEQRSSFDLEVAQIAVFKKVDSVAEAYFKKAVISGSKNPEPWLAYAKFLEARSRQRECLEILQEGFTFCPHSLELLEGKLFKKAQVEAHHAASS
ncbi:MAG: hypothetical protein JSR39_00160 [Verrucomicrobia bacterium]|nr:hypothetical protein [Verrucomicrobiota bacterium]